MSAKTLFVTGTDTGVGKTLVSAALVRGLRAIGYRAVGYKPVASGCEQTADGLRNEDALALLAASTPGWNYEAINPYAFEAPIAPHIAAADAGVLMEPATLDAGHARLAADSDWVIVEGAGGWQVPLSDDLDFADWASAAGWPVLLVVGMRLGCVNHAVLSAAAIAARTNLVGWIANCLPPLQPRIEENIESLRYRLSAPMVARIPANPAAELCLNPESWIARI